MIDFVAGSSETLFYDVPEIITGFNFKLAEVVWVKRHRCKEYLGITSEAQWLDACLLAGCDYLDTLPLLQSQPIPNNVPMIRRVVDLLKPHSTDKPGYAFLKARESDPSVRDYIHKYMKARIFVLHNVVMTPDGQVVPLSHEWWHF